MLVRSPVLSSTERPRLQLLRSGLAMLVHFITDEPAKIPAIRLMLEPRYHVVPRILGADDAPAESSGVLMIDADLRKAVRVEQIRQLVQELGPFLKNCLSSRTAFAPWLRRPMRSAPRP